MKTFIGVIGAVAAIVGAVILLGYCLHCVHHMSQPQIDSYWVENAAKLAADSDECKKVFNRVTSDGTMTWSDYHEIEASHSRAVMQRIRSSQNAR